MSSGKPKAEDRKQRLAKALKANIAKRKAQAKERQAPDRTEEAPKKD
jgi:ribosomal protein L39E